MKWEGVLALGKFPYTNKSVLYTNTSCFRGRYFGQAMSGIVDGLLSSKIYFQHVTLRLNFFRM